MYSCCLTMSQNSMKNSCGKVVFQILAKIEMTRNKNRSFGLHFETVQLFCCCRIMVFYSAYIHGANFIAKFCWKSGFLWVPRNPPWAPTEVKLPWPLKSYGVRSAVVLYDSLFLGIV